MKYYVCVDHTSKEPKESATTAMTAMQSLQSNERSVSLLLLPSQRSIDGLRSKEESDGFGVMCYVRRRQGGEER